MKNAILILAIFLFSLSNAQEQKRSISVNGTHELTLPADQINIEVKIETIDSSIEYSKKANDKSTNDLLMILKNEDIQSSDISVSPIRLGKKYDYINNVKKFIGYFTEVDVSVLLKDLSKYYELSNKIATKNIYEIQRSSYGISNYESVHRSVYEKALLAAKEKAEYMAKALGVNIGEVLSISESNYWGETSAFTNTMASEESKPSSSSGRITIRRSVRVEFTLK